MPFAFITKQEAAPSHFLQPRAVLREELGAFRSGFIERKVRVSSEIPARLPASLPLSGELMGGLLRSFLEFAAAEAGLRALAVGIDWRSERSGGGTGVLRLDLVMEGGFRPEADKRLRGAMEGACRALGAKLAVEPEGAARVRCAVSFPPVHREGEAVPVPAQALAASASSSSAFSEKPGSNRDDAFALRHPFRVLAVDDSEIGLKLTVRLLRNLGYEPDQAASGTVALRMAAARPPESPYELIFMDLRMPEMDGRETMIELRKLAHGGGAFVVALTAEISELERRRCLEAGMSDFLTKPCRSDELAETIRTLSHSRREPAPQQVLAPALASPAAVRWEEAVVLDGAMIVPLRALPGTAYPMLLEELYESLRRDTPGTFGHAAEALRAGDLAELRHHLHQLTGNFEVVGARRMALFCRACSDAARREDFSEMKFLFEHFDSNYAALRVRLEAAIAEGR